MKTKKAPRRRHPPGVERARNPTNAGEGATANCEACNANSSGPDRPPAIGDLARNGSHAAAIRGVAGGCTVARARDEDLPANHETDAAARGLVVLDRGG